MENPDWVVRLVYVLQDPRARLADIKLKGKYVNPAGIQNNLPCILHTVYYIIA